MAKTVTMRAAKEVQARRVAYVRARVIGLPELLEGILVFLPINELFINQRVCRTWRDTIQKSADIRQRMFLRPSGPPLEATGTVPAEFDKDRDDGKVNMPEEIQNLRAIHEAHDFKVNPMREILNPSFDTSKDLRLREVSLEVFPGCYGSIKIIRPKYRSAADTSWRRMYITQPPITAIAFAYQDIREGGPYGSTIQNSQGLTLGDLYDGALEAERKHYAAPGKSCIGLWTTIEFCVAIPLSKKYL